MVVFGSNFLPQNRRHKSLYYEAKVGSFFSVYFNNGVSTAVQGLGGQKKALNLLELNSQTVVSF